MLLFLFDGLNPCLVTKYYSNVDYPRLHSPVQLLVRRGCTSYVVIVVSHPKCLPHLFKPP